MELFHVRISWSDDKSQDGSTTKLQPCRLLQPPSSASQQKLVKKTSWWLDRCYCRLRWIDWALQIPIVFRGKVLQSDCEYSYENVLPTYLNNTEKVLQTILQQLQYYINSRCADSRAILCNIFSARSITPSYAAWFQIIRSVFLSEKKHLHMQHDFK